MGYVYFCISFYLTSFAMISINNFRLDLSRMLIDNVKSNVLSKFKRSCAHMLVYKQSCYLQLSHLVKSNRK